MHDHITLHLVLINVNERREGSEAVKGDFGLDGVKFKDDSSWKWGKKYP